MADDIIGRAVEGEEVVYRDEEEHASWYALTLEQVEEIAHAKLDGYPMCPRLGPDGEPLPVVSRVAMLPEASKLMDMMYESVLERIRKDGMPPRKNAAGGTPPGRRPGKRRLGGR